MTWHDRRQHAVRHQRAPRWPIRVLNSDEIKLWQCAWRAPPIARRSYESCLKCLSDTSAALLRGCRRHPGQGVACRVGEGCGRGGSTDDNLATAYRDQFARHGDELAALAKAQTLRLFERPFDADWETASKARAKTERGYRFDFRYRAALASTLLVRLSEAISGDATVGTGARSHA
jgi:hypothetical protein